MNTEDQKVIDDYSEMFATAGWKYYVKSMGNDRAVTLNAAPESAKTNNEWQFCRGLLAQMANVINFETYVEAVVAQAKADQEAEKLAAEEG